MSEINSIITELYEAEWLNKLIEKFTTIHHREDLKQDLFVELYNQEEKVIRAHKDGWLRYFIVRVIKNWTVSSTSPFYKKYKDLVISADNLNIRDEDKNDDNDKYEKILHIVETKLDWFQKELFYMRYRIGDYDRYIGKKRVEDYLKPVMPYRKMEEQLTRQIGGKIYKFHYCSIYNHMNEILKIIRDNV